MADDLKITFHYLKSAAFRECHVDGVLGGATKKGLWFSLFSERAPVPQKSTYSLNPIKGEPDTFTLGKSISEESEAKEGIIRTLEVGVHMDLDTARALYTWLGKHLEGAEISRMDE